MSDEPHPRAIPGQRSPEKTLPMASGESLRPDRDLLLSTVEPIYASVRPNDLQLPRYEVIEEIGRGGMGIVLRAEQTELERQVAIKKVSSKNPQIRDTFLAEARVNARLDHPGIVPIYDLLFADNGDLALVMKLVRGTSWKELLHPADEGAGRDLDFHLGVLLSVANAVAFAHSRGLSHNDLKPSNVMVGEFGEVLVVDWGLALDIRDTPDDKAVAPHRSELSSPSGTPAYWAPELAKGTGKEIGPWTDVYLLGAILCEIATGSPPHRGSDVLSAIMSAMRSEPPDFEAEIPGGLSEICRKAMAREPRDRYPDIASFQEALRAFLKHRESMTIVAGAAARLSRLQSALGGKATPGAGSPERIRSYADFTEVAAGFQQALVLWPDNTAALEGERRASLALARLSLDNGDLGLAEVQASRFDRGDPEAVKLTREIGAAHAARRRADRNARWMRRGLGAAALGFVVGLSVALFAIRAAHHRSEEGFALATARLAGIRRLADVKQLADYTAEADALWPAHPDRVAAMEAWLVKARTLAGHLEGNRSYLAHLRQNAIERAPSFRFASAEEQWEHDTLAGLVAGLEAFNKGAIPGMEQRISFARTLRQVSIEDARAAWQKAALSIANPAECPLYRGLEVTPQLGLIPLGRDPGSGLWEFAHLPSGELTPRGPDGALRVTEATGVVLVLLPGGTFSMGARPVDTKHPRGSPGADEDAHLYEQPVHQVTLAPFFVAKHEFTQGQWLRATGNNPSNYPSGVVIGGRRHTLLHPAEQMTWKDADQTLRRLGLRLPTEAQWEYAARAGTTTPYWTGDDKASLQGAANLSDRYCKENGGPGSWQFELWLDDGYVVHAPIGSYRANAFGLHDMAGNVWEWVEDRYGGYALPVRPGDGERQAPEDKPRVFRGGGFRSTAVHARSADRYNLYGPDYRGFDVGLRAARALTRAE